MILSFWFSNFMSFKSYVEFDLRPNNYIDYWKESFNTSSLQGWNTLKTAIIFWENWGGKTNFFNAIGFLRWLIIRSFKNEVGQKISINPFILDNSASHKKAPSKFKISFILDESIVEYEIEINEEKVLYEKLDLVRNNNYKRYVDTLFERTQQNIEIDDKEWLLWLWESFQNQELMCCF